MDDDMLELDVDDMARFMHDDMDEKDEDESDE
jgi:hypothetical protein